MPIDSDQPTEVFRYPPPRDPVTPEPRTRATHPLVTFTAVAIAGLGIITWAWTGTWAWAVTGLVLTVLLAVASGLRS